MRIVRKGNESLKKMFVVLEKYAQKTESNREARCRGPGSYNARRYIRRRAARLYRINNKKK